MLSPLAYIILSYTSVFYCTSGVASSPLALQASLTVPVAARSVASSPLALQAGLTPTVLAFLAKQPHLSLGREGA
jgi:hypothetical protein